MTTGGAALYGPVQGLVLGDHNQVVINLPPGASIPFLAPPPPAHELVGRAELLAELSAALGRDEPDLALKGLPGVGKTAVAVALAHDRQLGTRFLHGVLWAGLGPEPDLLTELAGWGSALGIPAEQLAGAGTVEARARMVHAAIGLRRMLLVIDDAWTVPAALTFRLGGPNCRHLLTTRIPEVATRLAARVVAVPELDRRSGGELLTDLAGDAARADAEGLADLVQLVGGLPLALVLIGNYLRVRAAGGRPRRVREAIEQLRDARARLAVGADRGVFAGSLSLTASIEVSDRALPAVGRRALRDITAFAAKPNTFDADAAAAVLADGFDGVDGLVDVGLLEVVGDDRFTVHQAVHDYAGLEGATPAARERLVRYYGGILEDDAMSTPVSDTANVLAALEAAHELGLRAELVAGANRFSEHLNRRGLLAQAQVHLERAVLAADELGDPFGRSRARINLGAIYQQRGELRRAVEYLTEGLRLATEAGLGPLRFDALLKLGWVQGLLGRLPEARAAFDEALAVHDGRDRPGGRASVLHGMGWLASIHGRQGEAADALRLALAAARSAGEAHLAADILQRIGWLEGMRGRRHESQVAFAESAELARAGGFPIILVDAINGLGWLDGLRGDYRGARASFEEAIALAAATGYMERDTLLGGLAWVTREEGDYPAAYQSYGEALATARQRGDAEKTSLFLAKLAELEVLLDRPADARGHAREAVSIARAQELPDRLVDPLRLLATLTRQAGRPAEALGLLGEALALATTIGNGFLQADVLSERGLSHLDLGSPADLVAADSAFVAAEQHARAAQAGDAVGRAIFGRAQVARARADLAGARALAEAALDVLSSASPALLREVTRWRDDLPNSP